MQHSIQLLAQYLIAASTRLGCPPCPSHLFSEGDTPPAPWRACAGTAAVEGGPEPAAAAAAGPGEGSGSCQSASAAAAVAQLQVQAAGVLVPGATSHASLMVRSAAFTALASFARGPHSSVPCGLRSSVLAAAAAAAATDAAPAVRAAACKAVGSLGACVRALEDPHSFGRCSSGGEAGGSGSTSSAGGSGEGVGGGGAGARGDGVDEGGGVLGAVTLCLRDGMMSVRVAASWALASVADAVWAGHCHEAAPPAAGAAAEQPTSSAGVPHGPPCPTPRLLPHHLQQLGAVCSAATAACGDADKVRTNGVRAVGALLGVLSPGTAAAAGLDLGR